MPGAMVREKAPAEPGVYRCCMGSEARAKKVARMVMGQRVESHYLPFRTLATALITTAWDPYAGTPALQATVIFLPSPISPSQKPMGHPISKAYLQMCSCPKTL